MSLQETLKRIHNIMGRWIVIDIETTGLDPKQYEMLEIGAVLDNGKEWESGPIRVFKYQFESAALQCNGATDWHPQIRDIELNDFCDSDEVGSVRLVRDPVDTTVEVSDAIWNLMEFARGNLSAPMERFHIVGRYPKFDIGFLKYALENEAILDPRFRENFGQTTGEYPKGQTPFQNFQCVFDMEENLDIHDLVRWAALFQGFPPSDLTKDERYELIGSSVEPIPHRALQGALMEREQVLLALDFLRGQNHRLLL
jgi:hypothetical protein